MVEQIIKLKWNGADHSAENEDKTNIVTIKRWNMGKPQTRWCGDIAGVVGNNFEEPTSSCGPKQRKKNDC